VNTVANVVVRQPSRLESLPKCIVLAVERPRDGEMEIIGTRSDE
jgi:hypothetical protein